MASVAGSDPVQAATCLICFGDKAKLKEVGPCKHFFCVECLDKHLGSQHTGGEVFPCPSCQKECLLPASGVDGLDDWTRVPKETAGDVVPSDEGDEDTAMNTMDTTTSKRLCRICESRDIRPTPDAQFCCEQCRNVHMCKACADQHKLLPVTSHHVVTSLTDEKTGYTECTHHHMPLELYCNSCACPGCSLCVILDHGEHEVVEIGRVIRKASDDLEKVLNMGTAKLIELKQLGDETGAARDVILNWRGRMIQQVEEATEKAINQLLEQKEKLKSDIKTGCDVSGMVDMLQRIPVVEESIRKEVGKGQVILKGKKLDPGFLTELEKTRKELGVVLESDNLERDLHWKKLREPLPLFKESKTLKDVELGQMGQFHYDTRDMESTSKIALQYTDKQAVIHCGVASVDLTNYALGKSFKQPTKSTGDCTLFDNRDKEDDHVAGKAREQTLMDAGVVDMAATTDGEIALLHLIDVPAESQDEDAAMALTLFRPNEGNTTGKLICKNLESALSFSTNILGQFVVLSNRTDDIQQITVLNKNGDVIDTFETHNRGLRRVACGGRYTYILGRGSVEVYGIDKGKITFVNSVTVHDDADDITATLSDDVFVSISKPSGVDVVKVFHLGNYLELCFPLLLTRITKREGESRLDITNTWMVVSKGCSSELYKLH